MAQNKKDSKFLTQAMIVTGLIIVVGGVAAWRLGSRLSVGEDSSAESADTSADTSVTGDAADVTIQVASNGYSPSQITVNQGQKVSLKLVTNNTYGCARGFTIPKLGIIKNLEATGEDTVQFVAKDKGSFVFQCSMGMYRGVINVI